jgi:hypothetical protein
MAPLPGFWRLCAVFNENEKQIHGERLCAQNIGKKL